MGKRKITRRVFIRGVLVTGAALALGGRPLTGWIGRLAKVIAALLPRAPRPLSSSEHTWVMSTACADDLGGMPALYLTGTHYEMGYQHGTLARESVHAFRHAAYAYMTGLIEQVMNWPAGWRVSSPGRCPSGRSPRTGTPSPPRTSRRQGA